MQENGFKEETERTSKNNSVDEGLLKLSQGIKAIRKGLFEEGMSASNTYYLAFKKTNFTEEQASISPRVRMRECGSPSFSWEKIIKKYHPAILHPTVKKNNGPGKSYISRIKKEDGTFVETKVCLTSKHIKLNNSTKATSPNAFKGEPLWAQLAGEATERKLCSLRKQEAALSRIVKNVAVIKALREKQ